MCIRDRWRIAPEMIDELKHAYAYLTSSDKMIVKKYEIDHFEYESSEKGYEDKGKYCFVFKNSEDVFFEYPYAPVQAPHYRNDEEMDALPRIDTSEVNTRLEASKNTTSLDELSLVRWNIVKTEPGATPGFSGLAPSMVDVMLSSIDSSCINAGYNAS